MIVVEFFYRVAWNVQVTSGSPVKIKGNVIIDSLDMKLWKRHHHFTYGLHDHTVISGSQSESAAS